MYVCMTSWLSDGLTVSVLTMHPPPIPKPQPHNCPTQLLWLLLPETVPNPPTVCRKKAARTSSVAASVEMTDLSGLGDLASPLTDGRSLDNHGQSLAKMADRMHPQAATPDALDTHGEAGGEDASPAKPACLTWSCAVDKVFSNRSVLATVRP